MSAYQLAPDIGVSDFELAIINGNINKIIIIAFKAIFGKVNINY